MATVFKHRSPLAGQLDELFAGIARISPSGHQLALLKLSNHQAHTLVLDVTMHSHCADAAGAMTVEQAQRFRLCRGRGLRPTTHFPDNIADHPSDSFSQLISRQSERV